MNLLFIMFDDLRPELSIYGKDYITSPNFERLAQKSVVFDNAYCQVAVCNPSRDSLLTGLRPDTIGSFGFQTSYKPHLILPTRLKRSGYMTASYGKTMHHESADPEVWNYYQPCTPIDWYQYQNYERDHMNSSLTPDKYKPEEEFPDYNIATQVVKTMKQFHAEKQLFMISVGFKMPHLSMHVPYKYYDMYRSRADAWNLTEQERTYPPTTPSVSHRCCGDTQFKYMNQEGTLPSKRFQKLPWTTTYAPADMSKELMWGYAAMITFVDKQLGRVLDAVDELDLWSNLTIVLTADHGFHNGEKGVWLVAVTAAYTTQSANYRQ
jgi:iduronate 2-sulfatase